MLSLALPTLLAALWTAPALAEDAQVDEIEVKTREAAPDILSGIPEGVVVVYPDCGENTCNALLPEWFSIQAVIAPIEEEIESISGLRQEGSLRWTLGGPLYESFLQMPSVDPQERLSTLQRELSRAPKVTGLVYLWPEEWGSSVKVTWYTTALGLDSTRSGALTFDHVQGGDSPAAVEIPDQKPARSRRSFNPDPRVIGSVVASAGLATVAGTYAAYRLDPTIITVPEDTRKILRTPVLINSIGWVGLASGVLVVVVSR